MNRKPILLSLLVILLCSLAGGIFGENAEPRRDDLSVQERESIRTFTSILDNIESYYPGKVDSEQLLEDGIRGMLRDLDPHSTYLDRALYKAMKEEQRGSFCGLGIEVYKRGDFITVKRPLEDTPAYRMGVKAGDRITEVDGESTLDMPLDEAVSKLKGALGTKVSIVLKRYGVKQPIPMTLTRAKIATKSVTNAFLFRPGIGYIQLKNFTQQTRTELVKAIKDLRDAGAENLVLDLRGNPGGLLDQAVRVSEVFLRKGDVVVITKGRLPDANRTYTSERDPDWVKPLIVLVDHRSASASEIVAGAVQDHDRGLIVGQRTWGKGLVQSVYPLEDFGSALALTTAKYYTPSGRCIQRDWKQSIDDYNYPEEEDFQRYDEEVGADPFSTDTGRKVFAGGGIKPDYEVEREKISDFLRMLSYQVDAFFNFAVQYVEEHPEIPKDFKVDEKVVDDFKAYLQRENVSFTDKDLQDSMDHIRKALRGQIVSVAFGADEGSKIMLEDDEQMLRVVGLFPEAKKLAMSFVARPELLKSGAEPASRP
jgi:carboxyl-terminal processing protease